MASFTLDDLSGREVVIWGAGLEAQGALRRIVRRGVASVKVAVDDPGKDKGAIDAIRSVASVEVLTGPAATEQLVRADFVIASPGIPPSNPLWVKLRTVETTVNLWLADHGDRTLAITGSKGKSTTTHLLGQLMQHFVPGTAVGGNIGVAFFDLDEHAPMYVVEVGSPQCERLTFSPRGGGLTALFPEHLDFHGTLENYYRAKRNLFAHGSQFVITTPQVVREWAGVTELDEVRVVPDEALFLDEGRVSEGGSLVAPHLSDALRGAHNLSNVMVALGIVQDCGFDIADPAVATILSELPALEHRLQTVAVDQGVEWVDDSLATAPQPTAAALEVYAERPVVLIVGGLDRGVDYGSLADAVRRHGGVSAVVAIPTSGARIADAITAVQPKTTVIQAGSIAEAVTASASQSRPGGAVLFSPAAPSSGEHVNYKQRSEEFRAAISALERLPHSTPL